MGVSYSAWTVPGRTIASASGPAAATATETVGMAAASVISESPASASRRLQMPPAAAPTASATTNTSSIRGPGAPGTCRSPVTVISPESRTSGLTHIGVWQGAAPPSVHEGEHARHEDQGRHSREDETTDDGTPKWRVLLAAVAQTQSHREHADDHSKRRHQYWAEASEAGFERGVAGIDARLLHPVARETHHQDAVRR